jgi:pimeloyl-ACP methyl ester carboxylesterase
VKSEIRAILIHGAASSRRIWMRLLEAMESPEEILTPDIPGMGDAQLPGGAPLSFEGWLAYFRSLGSGRRVHLVGHSLGGAIAVHLAREPWVASVTLIAPATRAYCESRRIASRSGRDPGSIVFERPLNRLVAWPGRISREDAEVLREDYAKAGPLLSRGVPWPPYPMDEAEYLSGKPVLLVYGEEDAVIPTFYFRRLGEDLLAEGVCVTTVCLPGCGHIPQLEEPWALARVLSSFWAQPGLSGCD